MARFSLRARGGQGGDVVPDSGLILNGIIGGAVALGLARLLQAQYEARISDLKERVMAQSGKIEKLLTANAELGDSYAELGEAYKVQAEALRALAGRQTA